MEEVKHAAKRAALKMRFENIEADFAEVIFQNE